MQKFLIIKGKLIFNNLFWNFKFYKHGFKSIKERKEMVARKWFKNGKYWITSKKM